MKAAQRLIRTGLIPGLLIAATIAGCGRKSPSIDPVAYRQDIEQWQQRRLQRPKADDGWLTLCGLFWLGPGANTIGSDSTSMVILPRGKGPAHLGFLDLAQDGSVTFKALRGEKALYKDSAVTSMILHNDQEEAGPTILRTGSVSFYAIKRGDQYGVRMKDTDNPARVNFRGLQYFPIDPKWRVEATFEPYNPPKQLHLSSVIGTVEVDSCPGALTFEIDGKQLRLDAVMEEGTTDQLFIMFGDRTNGKETYSNGRQVYTPLPDKDNHVILDFNKAYNWPCVFTSYATCPIPPRQNQLDIAVEAGEKMYQGEH